MRWTANQLYAQLYDQSVPDWPGELGFYRELIGRSRSERLDMLEIACGTGRVTLQLARDGVNIIGLDLSAALLDIARSKSAGLANVRWIQGDMRTFDLDQRFGLIIIPGHSFQFMLTPADQVQSLETIKRHLLPGGLLVLHLDHQDVTWLGELLTTKGDIFETGSEVTHPTTGRKFRRSSAWNYDPASQTATVTLRFDELDPGGKIIEHWNTVPRSLHCIFRFEMEHLLNRVGLEILSVYGDFYKQELNNTSGNMIWIARNPALR